MQSCEWVGVTGNQRNIYLFIRIKVLNPHPALQATSKSLEILLPAAVDLLFHRNETGASLTTGLEYGMERQNGKWNGLVNVRSCS